MDGVAAAGSVLGAMITPAVLISAAGTLVLSTSNRLNRVVDRVRGLVREAEQTPPGEVGAGRAALIESQLELFGRRVGLLRAAMTAFYLAIGLLVATSIGVGLVTLFAWSHGGVVALGGLCGAGALFYGSLLLVREARLAVAATMQELRYARELVAARFHPPA